MRTTLVIDDNILAQAKRHALAADITLSELVARALREHLREGALPPDVPFVLATWGPDAPSQHLGPAEIWAAQEAEDLARLQRR